ncbi:MAG TPA: hypothetical protein VGR67_14235 [Candidatus Polarisedimenticolia bacterium]|jgi:hypothetical protein|nr:hypothetical protein [Candidatus Polarisedimenticolia bacterium]
MSGEGAQGASPPTLQGLGEIREFATDALRYWELRRLFYNLLLAIIVAGHFFAAWPASRSSLTLDGILGLFLLSVLANVAYSAVYVADVFIQVSGFRASRARWRWILLIVGFSFAAVLTHFMSSGFFNGHRPG